MGEIIAGTIATFQLICGILCSIFDVSRIFCVDLAIEASLRPRPFLVSYSVSIE